MIAELNEVARPRQKHFVVRTVVFSGHVLFDDKLIEPGSDGLAAGLNSPAVVLARRIATLLRQTARLSRIRDCPV